MNIYTWDSTNYHSLYTVPVFQGLYFIQAAAPENVFDYMDVVFENLELFTRAASRDQTENEIIQWVYLCCFLYLALYYILLFSD